ncbi:MAG: hypothetical protein QGI46_02745 [Planctomycetota bacterium]|nr:hypothetical protein [Planctomycetota bacterium]
MQEEYKRLAFGQVLGEAGSQINDKMTRVQTRRVALEKHRAVYAKVLDDRSLVVD